MPTTRIEYTAHYPLQLIPGTEWTDYGPTDRHTAEGIVRYVNARAKEAGIEERALLMQRTVTVGEWEPANTGIVPPHITERTESDDHREGPRQGEDDRDGGDGDEQSRPDDRRTPG